MVTALEGQCGETYNIGGGEAATIWDILRKLEALSGCRATIKQEPARPGDQRYTFADTTKLRRHFGWQARVSLDDGLARQWEWQKQELAETKSP
jgi:nucleoside-diphosphate-sugar epimerase